ncbi:MAG: hypothetical protein FWC69_03855 [Defluviitaleaceae bacterium]|nr:hypothetical protein [Defluviitaleaceae bacterium]
MSKDSKKVVTEYKSCDLDKTHSTNVPNGDMKANQEKDLMFLNFGGG